MLQLGHVYSGETQRMPQRETLVPNLSPGLEKEVVMGIKLVAQMELQGSVLVEAGDLKAKVEPGVNAVTKVPRARALGQPQVELARGEWCCIEVHQGSRMGQLPKCSGATGRQSCMTLISSVTSIHLRTHPPSLTTTRHTLSSTLARECLHIQRLISSR